MAKTPAAKVKITADEFGKLVNSEYGMQLIMSGNRSSLRMKRLSSGILSLDEALGGGWPFGKIGVIAGEYSTGKSLLALQACASVENYDHTTKTHRLLLPEGAKFDKGRALYVDVESAFDVEWASRNGFDPGHHMVATPDSSEQTIDIISRAIEEDVFDLIILDSIAQMTPSVEMDASAEDQQMGLAARLNNKAFRKWNSRLAQRLTLGCPGPFLMCINQMRMNIATMFGDPRTLPGGKGQTFAASVILYTKSAKYDDTKSAAMSSAQLSGLVYKNKTYKPKQNYALTVGLTDTDDLKCGEVNTLEQMVKQGKSHKLIVRTGGAFKFGGATFPSEAALMATLRVNEVLRFKLWRSIIRKVTGAEV